MISLAPDAGPPTHLSAAGFPLLFFAGLATRRGVLFHPRHTGGRIVVRSAR